ncbi:hypothetical protein EDC19_1082 [Natranaerovirga hydrolytica]|uniref:Uncharacterized protein n=1 Tax=Natranaerovirga hydrolytica TaxID=680378 RepID=A0A4R1N6J3_9FIRM|nr:hypothetical protein [Natranaerovirga hydrolytica]TCK98649.1 hypothetical protein EDC19_1082 [Natranaerovirga hydrolytica]
MKKVIIKVCIGIVVIGLGIGFVDYWRVCHLFEKPIFTIPIMTSDDGGSGTYQGLGYSFEIQGNFMPEDEHFGVTHFEYYWFGNLVKKGMQE